MLSIAHPNCSLLEQIPLGSDNIFKFYQSLCWAVFWANILKVITTAALENWWQRREHRRRWLGKAKEEGPSWVFTSNFAWSWTSVWVFGIETHYKVICETSLTQLTNQMSQKGCWQNVMVHLWQPDKWPPSLSFSHPCCHGAVGASSLLLALPWLLPLWKSPASQELFAGKPKSQGKL